MKICPKCGLSQNDSRQTCVDCGAVLGSPVDEETAYQTEKARREAIAELEERSDVFSLGRARLPLLVFSAAGLVCAALALYFRRPEDPRWPLVALFLFLPALVNTLFPTLMWKLELFRLSVRYGNADMLTPGWGFSVGKWLISLVFPIIGAGALLYGFLFF